MVFIFIGGLGFGLLLGGCAKKEEEKIVITIQTDMPEEEAASPRSAETGKPEAAPSVVAKAPKPVSREPQPSAPSTGVREKQMPSEPPSQRPPSPSSEVASGIPVAPAPPVTAPAPRRASTEEDRILAIVRRQEAAFEEKDMALYTADLATVPSDTRKQLTRIFEQFEEIEVKYAPLEITIEGESARLILLQTTHLVPKKGGKAVDQQVKVLWGLIKVDGDWKINETKPLQD
jgi:ketosteroid isomerase-like protein